MAEETTTAPEAQAEDAPVATAEAEASAETTEAPVTEEPTAEAAPAEAAPAPVSAPPHSYRQPELKDSLQQLTPPEERKDVPGGREYEIIYIVRVGAEETPQQSADKVRAFIDKNGGAIDNVRISETRRLAYPIAKQIEGIYVVINARFLKDLTTELDRFFKLEEAVLRHMVLRDAD